MSDAPSYYHRAADGTVRGPLTAGRVRQLIGEGKVTRGDRLAPGPSGPWRRADGIPNLFPDPAPAPSARREPVPASPPAPPNPRETERGIDFDDPADGPAGPGGPGVGIASGLLGFERFFIVPLARVVMLVGYVLCTLAAVAALVGLATGVVGTLLAPEAPAAVHVGIRPVSRNKVVQLSRRARVCA